MDEHRIKQRIIGAIVLVSLAVIFIPMILSGGRDQSMPLFGSPIPPKPENITSIKVLEFENIPKPPQPATVMTSPVDQHSKDGDEPVEPLVKPVNKPKPELATKQPDKPARPLKAWVVQVGSFTKSTNALNLKDKLVKNGFRAFVERVTTKTQTSYRVRVGPEIRHDNALKLQKQIEQKMNIKGLVVTHP